MNITLEHWPYMVGISAELYHNANQQTHVYSCSLVWARSEQEARGEKPEGHTP